MNFYIHTFGCRVNAAESTLLSKRLKEYGFRQSNYTDAQLIVINTCAVTQKAERTARQFIYRIKRIKPNSFVIVTGCSATLWNKQKKDMSQADMIIDNTEKEYIADVIKKKFNKISKKERTKYLGNVSGKFLSSGRLMVHVQKGCDYFCTFCIVPFLRGLSHSIDPNITLGYIRDMSSHELVSEVIITGINLGLYGKDKKYNLVGLVNKILKSTDIPRISFGSLYTQNITESFLGLWQSKHMDRLTKYFHIPLQSGSQKILSLMRRRYTLNEFSSKVEALSSIVESPLIATDIIVGFLGETDKDFSETYNYLEKSVISKAHIFRFSPRPNTAAYYMRKKIIEPTPEQKKKRSKALHQLFRKKITCFRQSLFGQYDTALVHAKYDNRIYRGILSCNEPVFIVSSVKLSVPSMQNIKIESFKNNRLYAKLA